MLCHFPDLLDSPFYALFNFDTNYTLRRQKLTNKFPQFEIRVTRNQNATYNTNHHVYHNNKRNKAANNAAGSTRRSPSPQKPHHASNHQRHKGQRLRRSSHGCTPTCDRTTQGEPSQLPNPAKCTPRITTTLSSLTTTSPFLHPSLHPHLPHHSHLHTSHRSQPCPSPPPRSLCPNHHEHDNHHELPNRPPILRPPGLHLHPTLLPFHPAPRDFPPPRTLSPRQCIESVARSVDLWAAGGDGRCVYAWGCACDGYEGQG